MCRLQFHNTKVTDLTPLTECDFSYAYENGGVGFGANGMKISEEDFQAIGSIRVFTDIAFTDADPAVWIPALSGSEIHRIGAAGDLRTNEDLEAFVADHPELESIWLGWAERITDLTPLLSLENLEIVTIDHDMKEAISSIEGRDFGFELELN